jgi:hypothetical protein
MWDHLKWHGEMVLYRSSRVNFNPLLIVNGSSGSRCPTLYNHCSVVSNSRMPKHCRLILRYTWHDTSIQQLQHSKKPPEAVILNLINYHILLFILWWDIEHRERRRAAKKVERNQSMVHVCNWKIVLGNGSPFKVQIRQAFPLFTSTLHSVAYMNCRSWRWKDSMLYTYRVQHFPAGRPVSYVQILNGS